MEQILLVEDDLEICEIIQFHLNKAKKYETSIVHSAEEALTFLEANYVDLILLDIQLPTKSGITLCSELRKILFCPIIFISCFDDDVTIVSAMKEGGDDYLVKPFRYPVLLAHIEANLRKSRRYGIEHECISVRDLTLNTKNKNVMLANNQLSLSPTQYAILRYLMQHKGRYVSFDEVYQTVWQRPSLGDYRSLFVHIFHLRKLIETDPSTPEYIKTITRSGYIFLES